VILPEVGNAIWKKVRRGELSADEAQDLVADLATVALETVSMRGLISDAYAIAIATGTTVYDATYLTLAIRLETQMITGDERFARKLSEHPLLVPHVRFLEDFVSE
jgi:predicted nucleic acid-binding protein